MTATGENSRGFGSLAAFGARRSKFFPPTRRGLAPNCPRGVGPQQVAQIELRPSGDQTEARCRPAPIATSQPGAVVATSTASALPFVSMSTAAHVFVVPREVRPSQVRAVLMPISRSAVRRGERLSNATPAAPGPRNPAQGLDKHRWAGYSVLLQLVQWRVDVRLSH